MGLWRVYFGAYKLQVVHPPGAGLFVLIGRMFTWVADLVSDKQSDIAFAVNLMSSLSSALAAMFMAWVTMLLGKMALVGRNDEPSAGQNIALALAGLVAGLSSAFITSVWFSAVEVRYMPCQHFHSPYFLGRCKMVPPAR